MAKEYYLYVKGKAVPVSEEVYKAYWKITEHEKYLQRKDWKHNVISFSCCLTVFCKERLSTFFDT